MQTNITLELSSEDLKKQQRKQRYEQNKEEIRRRGREFYRKNREKIIQDQKNYYSHNKGKCKQSLKEYNLRNKEKLKQHRKERYQQNKQYYIQKAKEYAEQNKEKRDQLVKEYRHRNKEKIKEYAQSRREINRQRHNNRYKNDPIYKLSRTLRARLISAIKNKAIKKYQPTLDMIGCTIEQLRLHIEQQWLPGMTWENHTQRGWHIDHIKPVNTFDLTDIEQQKQCFHYTNLRPLWAVDNKSRPWSG